ncbi:hypothetical protein [Plastoroseomonas hellenica]|uniref:WGR domain-containing protein n=1 Tax=Plastoroseomonas hellenica TaxID=2687306 RepID=A0ABS5ESQ5_9PROT|nr:hypothetical protein [Plastoroseomonas hellenica]MBR0646458.1 hypothetical protein [Plastoroseomonas hellenica]MBR0663327.1 hypothetical protein [Plastoroseomonas hellenica]
MFIHSLQRRAFGVELWAVLPARGHADRTYFVRVHGQGRPDRHFADATEALDEFLRKVREAIGDAQAPDAYQFDGSGAAFTPRNDRI